jgi:hypothetical protein
MSLSRSYYTLITETERQARIKRAAVSNASVVTLAFAVGFLLAAFLGVWAAYDLRLALPRLALLVVGWSVLIGLPWLSSCHGSQTIGFAALGCSWLGASVALLFLVLGNEYSGASAESIAVLLPLGASGVIWGWSRQRVFSIVTFFALAVAFITLVSTLERSAWLSLVIGGFVTGAYYWYMEASSKMDLRSLLKAIVIAAVFVLVVWLLLLVALAISGQMVGATTMGNSALSRLALWRNTLSIIGDYPFTGSGLGSTAMIYATYVALLHVPYYYHAHNLYLQLAVEQGVFGLVAFVGMTTAAGYGLIRTYQQARRLRPFYLATILSLATLLVRGLVDGEIYGTALVPIMFIPFAFALAVQWATAHPVALPLALRKTLFVSFVPILIVALLFSWPQARAALHANVGAVAQAKAELAVYSWPSWKIQDEMRRDGLVDLSAAVGSYHQALGLDPGNVTAHQRLGQIALSQGDYPSARQHLERAYTLAPDRRAVRQLLGEVYAVTGDLDAAVALWRTIDTSQEQLKLRHWWYTHLDAKQEAEWLQRAIDLLEELASQSHQFSTAKS